MCRLLILLILTVSCIITTVHPTLTPKNTKSSKQKPIKVRKGPQNATVASRNLINESPTSKEIIQNHQSFFRETDEYNVDGVVLGFVTPWNNHGYDVAKIWGNKFTHISPVWLQIRRKSAKSYELTGTHDIDKDWMVHVKNAGRQRHVKIVPRVIFDGWYGKDFTKLINDNDEIQAFIDTLIKNADKYNFNGYVIEVWLQLAGRIKDHILIDFIKTIGERLLLHNLDFILVIPPKRSETFLFNDEHFDELYDYVTAFSLMTYDFSQPHQPGPNSPIEWMKNCVESLTDKKQQRHKILVGYNFYGNDYYDNGGGPIVGHDYIKHLEAFNGKLQYNPVVAEHYFAYKDSNGVRHVIFYPTLYSIDQRIKTCQDLGAGIAIWEIGQGLDYFYDLL